ncbi:hypothetical protein P9112_005117 [Eukaryota sp. TZLM1-RC]
MTPTHSVSCVFTRSCAPNSLLTPAAVQQIRTDLPLVTEICHEASLLLQSLLLNFPLASTTLVEQDQFQNCNFINRKGLSPYLACRARQLASNVKTSLPKICQSWTKHFIRAHCRALDKTNVFANNILSLLPDEPLAQFEEEVVDSVLEHYIDFNLKNSRERFFLLNACKFILNILQRFPTTASIRSSHDEITFSSKELGELFSLILKFHDTYSLSFFTCIAGRNLE